MATVNRVLGEWCTGQVVWSYDYNDQSMRLSALHCVNNSDRVTTLKATSNSTGAVVNFTCQAHSTLDQNIPAGQAANFGVVLDARGRIDGISWEVQAC